MLHIRGRSSMVSVRHLRRLRVLQLAFNIHEDLAGGLDLLEDAYNRYLTDVFARVTALHIACFALSLVIMLFFIVFMLRPLLAVATCETRRIAELLSQLPKEIDIESEVQAVIAKASGEDASANAAPPPAAAVSAGAVSSASLVFFKSSPSLTE